VCLSSPSGAVSEYGYIESIEQVFDGGRNCSDLVRRSFMFCG